MTHPATLLLLVLLVIIGLVIAIARFKLHPFIALTLAAIIVGLLSKMKPAEIAATFQEGMGNTLGFLAVVVGLGLVLGKLLSISGGAHVIAQRFTLLLGANRLSWVMLGLALIVGLPVLFTVGLMLLVPIIDALARETKRPLLPLALPALAGLSCSQGFLPPHPGPLFAIQQLGGNVGKTILFGFLVGVPTAIVAGPLFAKLFGPHLPDTATPKFAPQPPTSSSQNPPGFAPTLLTALLPVLLVLLATLVDFTLPTGHVARQLADFIGNPMIAMLLAVLLALYVFGYSRGLNSTRLLRSVEECLLPAASILLVVGAGGGFSKMLDRGGAGTAIADIVKQVHISPFLLGWCVAASIRLAVGSATVAIATASAILAPVAADSPNLNRELLVIALGAGSLFCSHVNDGGFWLVKESFNLTVTQTLKTWTVMETSIGLVGLALVMLLAQFF
jgi:gluconate:H+ symporter, GntP family